MKQFRSTLASCKYILRSGKVIHFNCGIYNTDNEKEIAEIEEELANGNEFFLPSREIAADEIDPMSALRKKIIEEYKAAEAAALNPENNMGTTGGTATPTIANSATIAPVTAGVKAAITVPSSAKK